ncbi:acyl-CoA dehydrogenase family protein [Mycobacterium paraintracellulare]|uniref:acyl-CoA dehydrogenase family protein n=1 Tax=Mycobacterium paraintracellulare TaxID=1138383 RepID=UPI0019158A0A|nr:acyl-CoA dehydrogenase family protein [Mycobacterium paraintracellulare]
MVLDDEVILARAKEIEPILRSHSAEAERERRLSQPVVDALRWSGVFRMAMPTAWGGPEADVCKQVEIIETLARADASAAWCAMIGSESGFWASYIEETAARRLFPSLDMITAGFQGPAGILEVCDGGYRLSGRWPFGSGVTHADVILGGATVVEHGESRRTASGRTEYRIAMLPAQQWQIHETWDPDGLAGSGSHDYMIFDAFVPEDYTFTPGLYKRAEPLYSWFGLAPSAGVGVPLGVAAEALDVARRSLEVKVSNVSMRSVSGEPSVRSALARATVLIGSTRSYVYDTLGALIATLEAGDRPTFDQRAQWAGCVVHTGTTCREAVQILVDAVGSGALQRSSPLSRHMRDLNMIAQHGLTNQRVWEWAGGLYFGQSPPSPAY